jgi:hypothetical protein
LLISLVPNLLQNITEGDREDYADLDDQETVSDYSGGQDADENTRLIGRGTKPSIRARVVDGVTTNPLFVAVLAGVLIGLIKAIQRGLIGDVEHSTGGWQTLGGGLILLAGAYAAVEMIAIGATIRAGEAK